MEFRLSRLLILSSFTVCIGAFRCSCDFSGDSQDKPDIVGVSALTLRRSAYNPASNSTSFEAPPHYLNHHSRRLSTLPQPSLTVTLLQPSLTSALPQPSHTGSPRYLNHLSLFLNNHSRLPQPSFHTASPITHGPHYLNNLSTLPQPPHTVP